MVACILKPLILIQFFIYYILSELIQCDILACIFNYFLLVFKSILLIMNNIYICACMHIFIYLFNFYSTVTCQYIFIYKLSPVSTFLLANCHLSVHFYLQTVTCQYIFLETVTCQYIFCLQTVTCQYIFVYKNCHLSVHFLSTVTCQYIFIYKLSSVSTFLFTNCHMSVHLYLQTVNRSFYQPTVQGHMIGTFFTFPVQDFWCITNTNMFIT